MGDDQFPDWSVPVRSDDLREVLSLVASTPLPTAVTADFDQRRAKVRELLVAAGVDPDSPELPEIWVVGGRVAGGLLVELGIEVERVAQFMLAWWSLGLGVPGKE